MQKRLAVYPGFTAHFGAKQSDNLSGSRVFQPIADFSGTGLFIGRLFSMHIVNRNRVPVAGGQLQLCRVDGQTDFDGARAFEVSHRIFSV